MAAEAGVATAMTKVASWLYDGIGVEKSDEESKIWYKRAAEAGDPVAMRVVAFTSKDDAEKFRWYKLSAELDRPGLNKQDSIKQTAINYACGRGTEKNLSKAEEWLAKLSESEADSARMEIADITGDNSWMEQAAENSPQAMVKMAESFVKQNDFESALVWYEKASDAGDFEATSLIGDIYYIGEGNIEQNYLRALEYYERAAAKGYNMAAIKIALMKYHGRGCPADRDEAYEMFKIIAHRREPFFGVLRYNSVAKFYLGCLSEDDSESRKWLNRAAGLKRMDEYESMHLVPEAIYKIADDYFMRKHFSRAVILYEKLAESSSPFNFPYNLETAKKLMWMNELGEGIPQDKAKAAEWREKLPTD